jgi:hypothetical protein
VPADARGVVVFVHGSGSSRRSPRNRYVAGTLQQAALATLPFDLLTPGEERDRGNVFDIDLLSGRLAAVTSWVRDRRGCRGLPVGYFGACGVPERGYRRRAAGLGCAFTPHPRTRSPPETVIVPYAVWAPLPCWRCARRIPAALGGAQSQ